MRHPEEKRVVAPDEPVEMNARRATAEKGKGAAIDLADHAVFVIPHIEQLAMGSVQTQSREMRAQLLEPGIGRQAKAVPIFGRERGKRIEQARIDPAEGGVSQPDRFSAARKMCRTAARDMRKETVCRVVWHG
ncbi:hypothetical protein AA21291_0588 [Swaminathania salitolerans LMG 21291]|uniref:Uncharacterized protein n=1 Tax=Swaminathania salitolerans TaxID=182838 RepID=A0A511BPD6_9PROT|nr:hypothetical protein AA21291_0588 [Swaminathania salitolerans LMG 21291]GEL02196.1 hypothetical protein SSA02_13590 [Swaminathania salitolerans]